MYVLCFRMKSMMDVAWFKSHLLIEPILNHKLSPLKVRRFWGTAKDIKKSTQHVLLQN